MSNFIEMPISFKRQYASSLVEDEVFENSEARLEYLNSGLAYSGQLVAQSDDATVYVVNSTKDGYIKLGSSSDLTFKIVNTYKVYILKLKILTKIKFNYKILLY